MKKIVLGIVVLIVLGGGVHWYFVLNQNKPSLPFIRKSPQEKLEGIWKPVQFLRWSDTGRQFQALEASQVSQSDRIGFLEFKDGSLCQGQFDPGGEARP